MTIVIGGVPRAGKTTLARILKDKFNYNFISTDLIRESFKYGIPEFGIKGDDYDQDEFTRSEILWPYLKGMLIARRDYDDNIIIEGTNFLPKYVAEFKNRSDIQIVFLGYADADVDVKFTEVRQFTSPECDWVSCLDDVSLKNLIGKYVKVSKHYKEECEKYGILYIDVSSGFTEQIDIGIKCLIR